MVCHDNTLIPIYTDLHALAMPGVWRTDTNVPRIRTITSNFLGATGPVLQEETNGAGSP